VSEIPWGKCTTCKKDILHGQKYWVCNVSTCNTKRNNYIFCTVGCWDAHVPLLRHKDSWAEEKMAPRKLMGPGATPAAKAPEEVLVVASKVKSYIKDRADMNTSDRVMEILSEKIKILCNDAIDKAREEGRKTVLDRDF
jgi:hypothetical protein